MAEIINGVIRNTSQVENEGKTPQVVYAREIQALHDLVWELLGKHGAAILAAQDVDITTLAGRGKVCELLAPVMTDLGAYMQERKIEAHIADCGGIDNAPAYLSDRQIESLTINLDAINSVMSIVASGISADLVGGLRDVAAAVRAEMLLRRDGSADLGIQAMRVG